MQFFAQSVGWCGIVATEQFGPIAPMLHVGLQHCSRTGPRTPRPQIRTCGKTSGFSLTPLLMVSYRYNMFLDICRSIRTRLAWMNGWPPGTATQTPRPNRRTVCDHLPFGTCGVNTKQPSMTLALRLIVSVASTWMLPLLFRTTPMWKWRHLPRKHTGEQWLDAQMAPPTAGQITVAGRVRYIRGLVKALASFFACDCIFVSGLDRSFLRIHPPLQGLVLTMSRDSLTTIDEAFGRFTCKRPIRKGNDLCRPF